MRSSQPPEWVLPLATPLSLEVSTVRAWELGRIAANGLILSVGSYGQLYIRKRLGITPNDAATNLPEL
jgi:hypothetical protein